MKRRPCSMPVILIHLGDSEYARTAVRLLRVVHGYRVILIGDDASRRIAVRYGGLYVPAADYEDTAWEQTELRFVHNSYLPSRFERFCFSRFKTLSNCVNALGLSKFLYLDSDILILNRSIVERLFDELAEADVALLSDQSTFFAGWTRGALEAYVASLPSYFAGDPWGDRHCDMFALKRFLSERPSLKSRTDIISTVPVYSPGTYFGDPNFSFAPLVMKRTGVWGYQELAAKLPSAEGLLQVKEGICYACFNEAETPYRVDFVHLNGFTKHYSSQLVPTVAELEQLSIGGRAPDALLQEVAGEIFRGVFGREPTAEWISASSAQLRASGLRGGISGLIGELLSPASRDATKV